MTLNVDGLGAKPLRLSPGVELPAGTLIQGTPYVATYFNSAAEWILQGLAGNPYNIPLGGMLEFTGTTAPNSSFVLPYGQPISRSIYAAYFAMVGTTYGAGDGSTFNVIDKRGRVSAGKEDMGGTSANRLTSAHLGASATVLGAAGGTEAVTLPQSALPNVSPAFIGTQQTVSANEGQFKRHSIVAGTADIGGGTATYSPATPSVTFTPAGTISSINGNVPQTAVGKVQPTIIVNYILRVL